MHNIPSALQTQFEACLWNEVECLKQVTLSRIRAPATEKFSHPAPHEQQGLPVFRQAPRGVRRPEPNGSHRIELPRGQIRTAQIGQQLQSMLQRAEPFESCRKLPKLLAQVRENILHALQDASYGPGLQLFMEIPKEQLMALNQEFGIGQSTRSQFYIHVASGFITSLLLHALPQMAKP